MTLLADIETIKTDIAGVLQIGAEQVPLSQKELLLFGILRLILGRTGGTGGGEGGSVVIDNVALANAIADALELKTLTVAGDAVNETALANAISAITQPVSVAALPLPTGAATESTLSNVLGKLPAALVSGRLPVDGSGVTQPVSGNVAIQDGTTAANKLSVASDGSIPTRTIDATPVTETALTAAGSTQARSVAGYRYYSYQVQITGIGTNVILRMEATHIEVPGVNDWYSLQANNIDTTITQNGSYKFQIAGETDLQTRMTIVSTSGGTPSVICTLIRGN